MSSAKRSAFTLIELLVVIVIVAVLAGLLLSGIGAAYRMVRKTKANTEVKSIASALEFYYSDYHQWPQVGFVNGVAMPVSGNLDAILEGENCVLSSVGQNPKKIQFMQFKTYQDGDPTNHLPVSPWWTSGTTNDCLYYCKVDVDFDNVISAGSPVPSSPLHRTVLVWTVNYDNGQYILSSD